ncbi:MAG TPA: hypothetical protein VFY29_10910, partial [Terriglobia bacterium]|nr:hypothetical protein [Terriglobia bacterium]
TTFRWAVDAIQPVMVELGNRPIYDPVASAYEPFFSHYNVNDYFPVMSKTAVDSRLRAIATEVGGRFVVVAYRRPPVESGDAQPRTPSQNELPDRLMKLTDLQPPFDYGEDYSLYLYSEDR